MSIDLLLIDVLDNLCVPRISTSISNVHVWNKQSFTYSEVLFVFANANLYDHIVIVFAYYVDPDVFISIFDWTHTEDF